MKFFFIKFFQCLIKNTMPTRPNDYSKSSKRRMESPHWAIAMKQKEEKRDRAARGNNAADTVSTSGSITSSGAEFKDQVARGNNAADTVSTSGSRNSSGAEFKDQVARGNGQDCRSIKARLFVCLCLVFMFFLFILGFLFHLFD